MSSSPRMKGVLKRLLPSLPPLCQLGPLRKGGGGGGGEGGGGGALATFNYLYPSPRVGG